MGLWETTTVSRMTGLQLPPEVVETMKAMGQFIPGAEPRTTVIQGMPTPEKWRENFPKGPAEPGLPH